VARRPALPKKPVATEALRRAALARDVQALGAPLAAQIERRAGGRSGGLQPHLGGIALVAGALVPWLAGASLVVVAVAFAALYGVGYAAARSVARRRRSQRLAPVVDLAGQFDRFVAAQATRLPPDAAASLHRIKALLARVLPALADPGAALTQEEAAFAREAVARYLPDAVRPFLALPPDRAEVAAGPEARTPRALLVEQLEMVERELARIDERLAAARAGELARNRELIERRTAR
jgi:hypothetical protein